MVETYSSMCFVCGEYCCLLFSPCYIYVSLGSRVIPSILGLMFMGTVVLFICSASCVCIFSGLV